MWQARLRSVLSFAGSAFRGNLLLIGAKVGGQLDASGSTFEGVLDMDSLAVGRSLYLRGGATFNGDVVFVGSKIGSDLDASDATFHGTMDASGW